MVNTIFLFLWTLSPVFPNSLSQFNFWTEFLSIMDWMWSYYGVSLLAELLFLASKNNWSTGCYKICHWSDIYHMRKLKENSNLPLFTVDPWSSWHGISIPSVCWWEGMFRTLKVAGNILRKHSLLAKLWRRPQQVNIK